MMLGSAGAQSSRNSVSADADTWRDDCLCSNMDSSNTRDLAKSATDAAPEDTIMPSKADRIRC